jgi:hypothetical protein
MERIDAAIPGVNLHGETVYPPAVQLHEAGVPFLFASAYGKPGIPEEFSRYPVMARPVTRLGDAPAAPRSHSSDERNAGVTKPVENTAPAPKKAGSSRGEEDVASWPAG